MHVLATIQAFTEAEQGMVMEKVDHLMPDFGSVEFFNDSEDLNEVLLGSDKAPLPAKEVDMERIIVFPIPRGCGDMKVCLMAN